MSEDNALDRIHTVLFVPMKGDQFGLVQDGPFGERPPLWGHQVTPELRHEECWDDTTCPVALCSGCGEVWPCPTPGEIAREHSEVWSPSLRHNGALVLYHDGGAVGAGCDRLARAIYAATDEFYRELWGDMYDPGRLRLEEVLSLARWAADLEGVGPDLGRVVLLDNRRKELTDEQ